MKPTLFLMICLLLRTSASALATSSRRGVSAVVADRRGLLHPFTRNSRSAVTLIDESDSSEVISTSSSTSLHQTYSDYIPTSTTTSIDTTLINSGHIAFRLARRTDVPQIQDCNIASLPENYNANFYINHMRTWPELTLVAEHIPEGYDITTNDNSRDTSSSRITPLGDYMRNLKSNNRPQKEIVGYILGKVEGRPIHPKRQIFPSARESRSSLSSSSSSSVPLYNNDEGTLSQYMNTRNTNGARFPSPRRNQQHRQHQNMERIGHITSLAVHHHARRLGIAKQLISQLHYHLQSIHDAQSIGLHVRISNKAAVDLYINEGYDVADIIPYYYGDGEDAYFMRKDFSTLISEEMPIQQRQSRKSQQSGEERQWRRGEKERNEWLNRDATKSGSFFNGRSSMRDNLSDEERAWHGMNSNINTNPVVSPAPRSSRGNNMSMMTGSPSSLSGQFKRSFRTFLNAGRAEQQSVVTASPQNQFNNNNSNNRRAPWEIGPEELRLPRYAKVSRPQQVVPDSGNFSLKDLVSQQGDDNDMRYEEEKGGVIDVHVAGGSR